jgi:hypothetical protein
MAAGIGLRVDQVAEIEEGTASDALRNPYAQWLDRLEAMAGNKRALQLLAAEESLQPGFGSIPRLSHPRSAQGAA